MQQVPTRVSRGGIVFVAHIFIQQSDGLARALKSRRKPATCFAPGHHNRPIIRSQLKPKQPLVGGGWGSEDLNEISFWNTWDVLLRLSDQSLQRVG